MKFLRLGFCIACLVAFFPTHAHAGWTMVFHDEFDGPTLDRDQWFTRGGANGELDHQNDEVQRYRDNDNHVFKDGHLELTARFLGGDKYESGEIISKRSFYYGYYEARVKLPSGKGVWPAFWMCCDYDAEGHTGWPPEIDVFEFANNAKDDTVHKVHTAAGNDDEQPPDYKDPRYIHNGFSSEEDITKNWHVFGFMWQPDRATLYVDGVKMYSKPYKWLYKDGRFAGPAPLILNLALGGQWAGRYGIDNDAFPQSLDIDYVRVYQYDPSKPNDVTSMPNVPDWASYSYNAPGDLARPVIYPAQMPATIKPGSLMKVVYHIDSIPTKYKTKLRISLNDASGKSVYQQSAELPHDTREAAEMIKAQVSVAVPDLSEGDYDVRLALAYCSTPECKPENFTNIPLTFADGAVREWGAWYRVGRFKIED